MKHRYYYYLIVNNMLVNVMMYVPRIMIIERFDGAVMGLLASTLLGLGLLLLFTYSIRRFPEQGLPEIAYRVLPSFLSKGILLLCGVIWYLAGLVALLIFADITQKYVSPETSNWTIVASYMAVVLYVAWIRTDRVLYTIEILFVMSVPFLSFVLVKSLFNEYINLDAMLTVAQHFTEWPSVPVIAAQTFSFSGYVNMLVFNRFFKSFNPKLNWLIGIVGFINLCFSFFLPIAYQGVDGVEDYVYPWVATADSMRIELGFVERVIYIFLLLYGFVTFSSIIIHWHVSLEMFKGALLKPGTKGRRMLIFQIAVSLVFIGIVVGMEFITNSEYLFQWANLWLQLRLFTEIALVGFIFYAALATRRRRT